MGMAKKADVNDLAELSEPLIDDAGKKLLERFVGQSLSELVQEIPLAKLGLVVGKLFESAREYHRTKNLVAFLSAFENGDKAMDEFDKLQEHTKQSLRGLVLSQLDLHSDETQAKALGLTVDAYLTRKIDRETFTGIVAELKSTNPLLYSAQTAPIYIYQDDLNKSILIARGPTYLLPAAFGYNTTSGGGTWGSSATNKFVLTKLGVGFIKHVYGPYFNGIASDD
ncbi:hypothetical protein JNJ66_00770 [Candidatus Saccharibacteria bacterium]|nr:hypothetical protein [Candidatus Saccharibacteria bacterium]